MKSCLNFLVGLRENFALLIVFLSFGQTACAAILYESGTLGVTGITWSELYAQTVDGANISSYVFNGVRFFVPQSAMTTNIGGHFVGHDSASGTFFGAVVRLDDAIDFPDSGDLATPDVLGAASITFPAPSADVRGELSLALDSGWYALVFGSGLFGTNGAGGAPLNNPDIGDPQYIGFQPGFGWANLLNPIFQNYRFVLEGRVVPEPSSIVMTVSVAMQLIRTTRLRPDRR